MARYESSIKFKCPICSEVVQADIVVPETHWIGDNADERFVEDDADVDCDHCSTGFMLHVQNGDCHIAAMVYDHEEVEVECSNAFMTMPDPPDYDDLDIPENPAESLINTLVDVSHVLRAAAASFYTPTVNRMAFIQQFAALEAYLSDTLIGLVLNKPAVLATALTAIHGLRDMKLSLAEIYADPDIVKRTVAGNLRDLMYHNFEKVGSIYHATLGFHLFPDSDCRQRMFKALPIRHDCVHRNGKDKEGNERSEVNDTFVKQIDADVRAIVKHIEAEIVKLPN